MKKEVRPFRALVAHDIDVVDRSMVELLRARGFQVLEADGADAAWRLACQDPVDVLLARLATPGSHNLDLLRRVRRWLAPLPGLLAIAGTHELERAARTAGAHVTLRTTIAGELVADTARRLVAPPVKLAL